LSDLLGVFDKHSSDRGDTLWTDRFYQISEWNPDRYHHLLREYERHYGLVQDLTFELTRAGNLVCDVVRSEIDPAFRAIDDVLTVVRGPNSRLEFEHIRPEYQEDERTLPAYPGLNEFLVTRRKRDYCADRDTYGDLP
jgi:hypothetical protein